MSGNTPAPTRGVPVDLGEGKIRRLRYPLRALREIREEFGADALAQGVGDEHVAKLLWYGWRWEDPTLTLEQVEEEVDLEILPTCLDALTRAMGGAGKVDLVATAVPQARNRSREKKT